MGLDQIRKSVRDRYEIFEKRHACAVLAGDYPGEFKDIIDILDAFYLESFHFTEKGGNKSKVALAIDAAFTKRGWVEKSWDTRIVVDQKESKSPTHNVDCYKNEVALELEWSNKDPFYDRDLNNFRLLFDLRVISVGVIITKSDDLHEVLKGFPKDVQQKYGATTTWMNKLVPRIEGGGGGGCPLLVFGLSSKCFKADD